jgi:molybdopterin-guanine dinucleotide biosynthesis protein B
MKAIGFTGDSGSGKTTLIERLIERFAGTPLRIAAIKHAHHGFDIDRPGKDSYRFRAAGASQVLVASGRRWVLMSEEPPLGEGEGEGEGTAGGALARQLARLDSCDLVFVEGYRGQAGLDFIEVRRVLDPAAPAPAAGRAPGPGVVAFACDRAHARALAGQALPVFALDEVDAIGRFVAARLGLQAC